MKPFPHGRNKAAFSLVELSIVLVILGLLVGGVLSGQSLIHAAQLRTVTTEYNTIVTATHSFKDKYFYLPGDMPNATQFWQRQEVGGYDSTCTSNSGAAMNPGTQQGACDGNGDGQIVDRSAFGATEGAQFWQLLKMSQLMQVNVQNGPIDGGIGLNYNGPTSNHNSRFPNGVWNVWYTPIDSDFRIDPVMVGNNTQMLTLGYPTGLTNPPVAVLMKAEDAWNIDTKLDDGNASTGKIVAPYVDDGSAPCHQGGTYTLGNYNLASTGNNCSLMFLNPF